MKLGIKTIAVKLNVKSGPRIKKLGLYEMLLAIVFGAHYFVKYDFISDGSAGGQALIVANSALFFVGIATAYLGQYIEDSIGLPSKKDGGN